MFFLPLGVLSDKVVDKSIRYLNEEKLYKFLTLINTKLREFRHKF